MAALPAILTVDDDEPVLRSIERDLRARYGDRYRVLAAGSGQEALELSREVTRRGDAIALFVVDQRMPVMTGIELLREALPLQPEAKRIHDALAPSPGDRARTARAREIRINTRPATGAMRLRRNRRMISCRGRVRRGASYSVAFRHQHAQRSCDSSDAGVLQRMHGRTHGSVERVHGNQPGQGRR